MIITFLKWLLAKLEHGNTSKFSNTKTVLITDLNGELCVSAPNGPAPTTYNLMGGDVVVVQVRDGVGDWIRQLEIDTPDGMVVLDIPSTININVNGDCGVVNAIIGDVSANTTRTINTVSGAVDVVTLFAPDGSQDSAINTTSGDVTVEVAMNNLTIDTVSGDVDVGERMPSGRTPDDLVDDVAESTVSIEITSVSGYITVKTSESIGSLAVDTLSGDVTINSTTSIDGDITANATSGDICIISGHIVPRDRITADSISGNVKFTTRDTAISHSG